jgi:hypothetical protein
MPGEFFAFTKFYASSNSMLFVSGLNFVIRKVRICPELRGSDLDAGPDVPPDFHRALSMDVSADKSRFAAGLLVCS